MNLVDQFDKAIELLNALHIDIDAMRAHPDEPLFGPFGGDGLYIEGTDIEWPNLAALDDEIVKFLAVAKRG